jgi:hypothetical protein
MLLVFDFFEKLFRVSSEYKGPIRERDPLLQLVNLSLSLETHIFLRDIIFLAVLSSDPTSILDRIMVQQVKHIKGRRAGPQEELLIFELMDTHRSSAQPLYICLKRTVSVHAPSFYFTDHPDSGTVLKSIMQTVMESGATPSTSVSISNDFLPSLDDPSFDQHLIPLSISEVYEADDRFIGTENIEDYNHHDLNLRQICPQSLSLFELAVLADTVHKHDPLYSTMRSQGYWFASTICDIISKEYACSEVTSTKHTVSNDDICIPPNDYLPDLTGRWMAIMVNRVKETVSLVIASKFRKYLQEKREEVRCFIVCLEPYLLKPRYRYETDGRSII